MIQVGWYTVVWLALAPPQILLKGLHYGMGFGADHLHDSSAKISPKPRYIALTLAERGIASWDPGRIKPPPVT